MFFDENSKLIDVINDKDVGQYIKYFFYDHAMEWKDRNVKNETSTFFLRAINWWKQKAMEGRVKQYFLDPNKPDVSIIHVSHQNNSKVLIDVSGGGLSSICHFHEGVPETEFFYEYGFDVFLLVYSINEGAYLEGPSEDINKAVKFIFDNQEMLKVDTKDYVVQGGSAGGYIVGQYGTKNHGYRKFNNPAPLCLCLLYPVLDFFISGNGNTGKYALHDTKDEKLLKEYSVPYNVDKDYPPVFFVHSKDDMCVPIENSRRFKKALDENHVLNKYIEYNTGTHGWSVALGFESETWMKEFFKFYESIK